MLVAEAAKGPVLQLNMSAALGVVNEPIPGKLMAFLETWPQTVPHWAWVSIWTGVEVYFDQTELT